MITFRTYPNHIDAALAQTHLPAAGIECYLADEAANSNTFAQFAIPVRLMVRKDQVQEAAKILDRDESGETAQ